MENSMSGHNITENHMLEGIPTPFVWGTLLICDNIYSMWTTREKKYER